MKVNLPEVRVQVTPGPAPRDGPAPGSHARPGPTRLGAAPWSRRPEQPRSGSRARDRSTAPATRGVPLERWARLPHSRGPARPPGQRGARVRQPRRRCCCLSDGVSQPGAAEPAVCQGSGEWMGSSAAGLLSTECRAVGRGGAPEPPKFPSAPDRQGVLPSLCFVRTAAARGESLSTASGLADTAVLSGLVSEQKG